MIDRAFARALRAAGEAHEVRDFDPWGGDERQLCSPGFDLPFGAVSRIPCGEYAGYHTDLDSLATIDERAVVRTADLLERVVDDLEGIELLDGTVRYGEPQLGKHDLWRSVGAGTAPKTEQERAILWLLSMADGEHSLQDAIESAGVGAVAVREAAARLRHAGLLVVDGPRLQRVG